MVQLSESVESLLRQQGSPQGNETFAEKLAIYIWLRSENYQSWATEAATSQIWRRTYTLQDTDPSFYSP